MISWQAYVIGVLLHVILVGATGGSVGAEPTPVSETPYWLALALIASGLVGVYALVVNYTVFRHKRVRLVPLWQAIAFHTGVGCIFAGTLLVGARILPVTPIEGTAAFSIATVAIGIWFGFTMSLILEARDRYRTIRSELIEQAVMAELATIAETEVTAALASAFHDDISSALATLEPLRGELADRLEDVRESPSGLSLDSSWRSVAHRLRAATDDAVRPLSHELWSATDVSYPNPSVREIVIDTIRRPVASAAATAAIVVIGYLRACMSAFGVVPGIALALVMAGTIGGMLFFVQRVRAGRTRTIAFWGVFVLAQMIGLFVALRDYQDSVAAAGTEVTGSALAMTISVLAPSTVATLNGARSGVLTRLSSDTARERINQIARGRHLASLARETATHLHGTVQTSLIACAAAIELATESEDLEGMVAAMERAVQVIGSVSHAQLPTTATVSEIVDRTIAPWEGMIEVVAEIAPQVATLTGPTAISVGRVVEECLANSVRHGDASRVRVRIESSNDGLVVDVEDDGVGRVEPTGQPGLGTAVLLEATSGQVTFAPASPASDRPGVRVQAIIPGIAEAPSHPSW